MKGKPQVTRMYGSMLYGRTNGNLSYLNIFLNFNRYIPFILNFDKMILTQDGTGGEIIHKKVRGNNDRLVLLLNGTDKSNVKGDYKNKYKFLNGKFIISYIGRVEGWKRTYLFSDTLNEVSKKIPNVCYLIVGTGVDLVKEKKKIDSNGLDEFIHFTGRVSQDERKYLMNLSDIYVSMYNYSNLSNTFLESISAGIPTLIIPNGNTKIIAKKI